MTDTTFQTAVLNLDTVLVGTPNPATITLAVAVAGWTTSTFLPISATVMSLNDNYQVVPLDFTETDDSGVTWFSLTSPTLANLDSSMIGVSQLYLTVKGNDMEAAIAFGFDSAAAVSTAGYLGVLEKVPTALKRKGKGNLLLNVE